MKEFQYDQVFMEDSSQEKILEDINVSTVYLCQVRGVKKFQYDQVFMEDLSQEKILEDTNVSTVYLCQVREV